MREMPSTFKAAHPPIALIVRSG
ncbi:uncharacterized protein METZ01_LOCUS293032, partial [marine metagenome]